MAITASFDRLRQILGVASLIVGLGILAPVSVSAQNLARSLQLIAQTNPPGTPVKPVAEPSNEKVSRAKFDRVMQYAIAQKLHQKTMPEIMQAIATQFIGTPYQAGLLDITSKERLILALDKFDCVLFVEAVLAIARGIAIQDYNYATFGERISDLRYRDGKLDGYCSRLHYFSEWIAENQARGTVKQITQELGGVKTNKSLNFMSNHRQKYAQLKSNEVFQCIVQAEQQLVDLDFIYIPSDKIKQAYSKMQAGDIVAIATKVKGLDFTHTGLVYRNRDRSIGLIHASPSGAVKISPDLHAYVNQVKEQQGIVIARPTDPR
ncbi:N-acetylmuramoyl-L-alanine amidase-like domain-containing protein [Pseudanabaena sp. PCC 6802]|uniref:N-acetylmuramoyl-L-alanine amidase-like domain-containing protein n=1 Tax=Pseudanabaena sp. PCC 6802 TaxID=118173 RepID=UPI001930A479|nr:N-acetylmuramoyl-L-alanine amidase-like domain-containing protein [Pseudanabaena sp. PCC 6802]